MGQKDEIVEMARLRKAGEPEPDEGEAGDDGEGDDGDDGDDGEDGEDGEDAGEDAADREEAGPLPMQGIEMPAVIQLNGADGAQLPPPDGDLFGPEDDIDMDIG
jgi:hypothetical protein